MQNLIPKGYLYENFKILKFDKFHFYFSEPGKITDKYMTKSRTKFVIIQFQFNYLIIFFEF